MKNIITNGLKEKGRNGITHTQIGGMMRFSLENNSIPLMTTKKLAWGVCLKELLWFMNGDTDNRLLQKENVKIFVSYVKKTKVLIFLNKKPFNSNGLKGFKI